MTQDHTYRPTQDETPGGPAHDTRRAAAAAGQSAALAKIRKLLAKAEDPAATVEEAETYTAKAAELVAAYGIDRALLAEEVPSSDVVGDRVVVLEAPYALDKAALLSGVATALRCRAVHRVRYVGEPRDPRKQISVHLFGFESDLLRVELLFTSLLLQATSQLTRAVPPAGESVAAYRRSWLAGFTAAVTTRLHAAEDRAGRRAERDRAAAPERSGGRSVELVLLDRSRAVESAMTAEYPRLRTAARRTLTGSGAGSGWAAGERADLGGARMPGRRRGELAG